MARKRTSNKKISTKTSGAMTKKKNNRKRKLNKKKLSFVIFVALLLILSISSLTVFAIKSMNAHKNVDTKQIKTEQTKVADKVEVSSSKNTGEKSKKTVIDSKKVGEDSKSQAKKKSKQYTILIDPGHGGNDKGTLSTDHEGIYEKDVTIKIGKQIAEKLSKQDDIEIIMTRTDDEYVSLSERAAMAKQYNVDALVSIHINAQVGANDARGIETWYRTGSTDGSDKFARVVQDTLLTYVDDRDRGIFENNFQVLRESNVPSILVECGFITNKEDEKNLFDSKYVSQLSDGIAQGVLSYIDNK
ncbi:MAG: N-acetylmuramoyl-L-alanine amidase [Clostridioides sp.]|jgi:N-acetylmuramoyl-L-alanine amidase|nr:N-acetylmuramoyl-L-alanine amidase [Clostridioides sp.]